MTAKEYLKQIRSISAKIENLKMEIVDIESKLGVQGISYDKIPSTPNGEDHRSKYIYKLIELRDKYLDECRTLAEKRADIIHTIHKIDDIRFQQVLYYRYVQGKTFEDISDLMGYSLVHIHRLHGWALQKAQDVIECYH